jgi:hypothetical protein
MENNVTNPTIPFVFQESDIFQTPFVFQHFLPDSPSSLNVLGDSQTKQIEEGIFTLKFDSEHHNHDSSGFGFVSKKFTTDTSETSPLNLGEVSFQPVHRIVKKGKRKILKDSPDKSIETDEKLSLDPLDSFDHHFDIQERKEKPEFRKLKHEKDYSGRETVKDAINSDEYYSYGLDNDGSFQNDLPKRVGVYNWPYQSGKCASIWQPQEKDHYPTWDDCGRDVAEQTFYIIQVFGEDITGVHRHEIDANVRNLDDNWDEYDSTDSEFDEDLEKGELDWIREKREYEVFPEQLKQREKEMEEWNERSLKIRKLELEIQEDYCQCALRQYSQYLDFEEWLYPNHIRCEWRDDFRRKSHGNLVNFEQDSNQFFGFIIERPNGPQIVEPTESWTRPEERSNDEGYEGFYAPHEFAYLYFQGFYDLVESNISCDTVHGTVIDLDRLYPGSELEKFVYKHWKEIQILLREKEIEIQERLEYYLERDMQKVEPILIPSTQTDPNTLDTQHFLKHFE